MDQTNPTSIQFVGSRSFIRANSPVTRFLNSLLGGLPRYVLGFLPLATLLLSACTTTPISFGSGPVKESDRSFVQRVSIEIENDQPIGRSAGPAGQASAAADRASDTAGIWITTSFQGASPASPIVAVLGFPFAAACGAVYGAVTSVPEETAYNIGIQVGRSFSLALFQEAAERVAKSPDYLLADRISFSQTEETQRARDRSKLHATNDSASRLKIAIRRWRLNGHGKDNPDLRLEIDADVDLVEGVSDEAVYHLSWRYRSPWHPWSLWIENNGALLQTQFSTASISLFERVFDETFLAVRLPLVRMNKNALYAVYVCGLRPDPNFVASVAATNVRTIETATPELKWEGIPRPEDRVQASPISSIDISDVTYDLKLWKKTASEGTADVKSVVGLKHPSYQVEEPLEWDTPYGWSVRARFRSRGLIQTTNWTEIHSAADMLHLFPPPATGCPYLIEARERPGRVFELIASKP